MAQETIANYFEKDHDRLDGLFRRFQEDKRPNFPEARRCFKEFKRGLERHIVWEEEILFPLFESKTGIHETGPTAMMRLEHREIKEALEKVHKKVREGNPETDEEEEALLSLLKEHNFKEEQVLYPMIDHWASEEEQEEVFAKMRKYPEETYGSCCSEP